MADHDGPRILMAVEQLRRAVPGGIGAYARGLLGGISQCADDGDDVDLTLLASRRPGRAAAGERNTVGRRPDPLDDLGRPLLLSHLPGPAMTRAWDHGVVHAPPGFDVVHSISSAAPPRRRHAPARHVVTVHDLAWRRHPETATERGARWHEAALGRALDSGASLVVTSKLVASDLVSDGVERSRITIAPGGSDHLVPEDAAQTEALLHRLGVHDGFVLTVSTLEPRKNVGRLVEAFEHLRASLPEPWSLLIVGPQGWGQQLSGPERPKGVVLAGAVSDATLTGLYRRARAFAYIPLTEGYGLPPLEAMRVGTPCVIANEVPSVVDLGDVGPPPAIIVDPFDVDDIAAGLLLALTDESARADFRVRGHAHAAARTWRTAAQQHMGLWRSLA